MKQVSFNWLSLNMYYNKNNLLFQLVATNIYRKQSLGGAPWNEIKSENIEILYLLSVLKESVKISYKKACFARKQVWISTVWHIF